MSSSKLFFNVEIALVKPQAFVLFYMAVYLIYVYYLHISSKPYTSHYVATTNIYENILSWNQEFPVGQKWAFKLDRFKLK